MTPPRWSTRYADDVRDALVRMVDEGESAAPTPTPPPQRRTRIRLVVAIVIALVLVVPASVTALVLANGSAPAGGSTSLTVPTDGSYGYDPMGDYAGVVGRLQAKRTGDHVCFWVTSTTRTGPFGRSPWYLVFPAGYHATASLGLVDDAGAEIAAVGDPVAVYSLPNALGRSAQGCPSGTTLTALHVERSADPTPTPTSTARPAAAGCAPTTGSGIPTGADTGQIDDVDGDHRPDTEWAVLVGGTIMFGITTASGATVSGRAGFAGGGERTFVVGRLANGVTVVIPSDGRSSDVLTFEDCRLRQTEGTNPNLPAVGNSFTLYSDGGGGDAMCLEGRLYAVSFDVRDGDLTTVIGQRVLVTADGAKASLSSTKRTLATRLDAAEVLRYRGISCGDSPVLRPTQAP